MKVKHGFNNKNTTHPQCKNTSSKKIVAQRGNRTVTVKSRGMMFRQDSVAKLAMRVNQAVSENIGLKYAENMILFAILSDENRSSMSN